MRRTFILKNILSCYVESYIATGINILKRKWQTNKIGGGHVGQDICLNPNLINKNKICGMKGVTI